MTASTSKKAKKGTLRRYDGAGHLDPKYAADLLAFSERGTEKAAGRMRSPDSLAEQLGEACVRSMTSGEDEGQDTFSDAVPEESGGPFVITKAKTEFAMGTDESNPEDALREPFPKT